MSLTDAVDSLSDYLNNSIKAGNESFQANDVRQAAQPAGQLTTSLTKATSQSTLDSLGSNPIVDTATDTVNQAASGIAAGVVSTAISKVNLTPLQNATSQFFTLFASVTSFGTEVAMQFARNTGNNLINALNQKEAVSQQLEAQVVALYNASALLLNGTPFYNQYLTNVLQAYQLLIQADKNLHTVVNRLNPGANTSNSSVGNLTAVTSGTPFYSSRLFDTAIAEMTQAQELILPSNTANVSSITSTKNFISGTIARQSNLNSYAAALSIPGIALQIGKLVLEYELLSVQANAYINAYLRLLADYIAGYQQSNSVNQATTDHINSGISQLENLMNQMSTILSQNPTTFTPPQAAPASYQAKLSSYGIQWGVTLAAVIAWLKANPGAGSALLTQTSQSVTAYNKSVATIQGLGNIPFNGGTVFVTGGEEDAFKGMVLPVAKLLVSANLIVATNQSKNDIRTQAITVRTYLQQARINDAKIIQAITPFINTKTTLSGPVLQGINTLIAFANKAGLDRIAGLLTNGDVKNLFSATADNSTYAGAAVVGINSILTQLQALPDATTQQISQLTNLRDKVASTQQAQSVYAGRSAAQTQGADQAATAAQVKNDQALVASAQLTASQLDATTANDPSQQTQALMQNQVTPGLMPSVSDTQAAIS